MNVRTSYEEARGCGYRKEGGLYMVSKGVMAPCMRLPIELGRCPCCDSGIKPSRGWTWLNVQLLVQDKPCAAGNDCRKDCSMRKPQEKAGLLWVGEKFYPRPEDFLKEAAHMGVSRRISAIPKGFKVGETWIYFAHRKAIEIRKDEFKPAIFHGFCPQRIEYIVKPTDSKEHLESLVKRGIELVRVVRGRQPDLNLN